jgi:protein-S-isoprenylcysteine O-methyltransferase Ste14
MMSTLLIIAGLMLLPALFRQVTKTRDLCGRGLPWRESALLAAAILFYASSAFAMARFGSSWVATGFMALVAIAMWARLWEQRRAKPVS